MNRGLTVYLCSGNVNANPPMFMQYFICIVVDELWTWLHMQFKSPALVHLVCC